MLNERWKRVVAALVALVVALVAALGVESATDDEPDRPRTSTEQTQPTNTPPTESGGTTTVTVNEAPGDGAPTTTVKVPTEAVDAAESAAEVHDDLRDETPEHAPDEALDKAQDQVEQITERLDPLPTAGASAGFAGCVTRFVGNQSSRGGTRPIWQVDHYTVSPNRPGWSDVNAIVALFDRLPSKVSSHFVIDREGNCAYTVPIERNAWTNAAGNRLSVNYEIINSGREGSFMSTPGYRKLRSVKREVARRTGIRLGRGSVALTRPGCVQHRDGGLAWGGHVDISPYDHAAVTRLTCTPASTATATITRTDRRRCSAIRDWRRAGRPTGGAWERKSVWRRKALERKRLVCTDSGVRSRRA